MPKIELHVHLDGSIPYSYFLNHGYSLEQVKSLVTVDKNVTSLNDYLEKFDVPISLMQERSSLIEISKLLGEELMSENVIYAEVRFAPLKHTLKGLSLEDVVEAVKMGLEFSKIKFNLILCMMRNDSISDNKKIVDLAYKYHYPIDLAGAEALYKTESFKELFDYANSLNVLFTIHAGEADRYESVDSAILFGAKRIGHGVNAIHNKNTLSKIKSKDILLEVCLTSNIQTGICSYEDHPIKKLYNDGILISVNTDNRTVSGISLTSEYEKLVKYFKFSMDDFKKMNLDAIDKSFLSLSEKDELRKYFLNTWKQ